MTKQFDGFSQPATDFICLRRALYGPEDAQALMLRCFRMYPKAVRITEPMLMNAWQAQDDALNAALEGVTVEDIKAERAAKAADFVSSRRV